MRTIHAIFEDGILRPKEQLDLPQGTQVELLLREPQDDAEHTETRPCGETLNPHAPAVWEMVAQIGEAVDEEDWKNVPTDLAAKLDHYLYGDKQAGE